MLSYAPHSPHFSFSCSLHLCTSTTSVTNVLIPTSAIAPSSTVADSDQPTSPIPVSTSPSGDSTSISAAGLSETSSLSNTGAEDPSPSPTSAAGFPETSSLSSTGGLPSSSGSDTDAPSNPSTAYPNVTSSTSTIVKHRPSPTPSPTVAGPAITVPTATSTLGSITLAPASTGLSSNSSKTQSPTAGSLARKTNVGAIAGGVIGGLCLFALLAVLLVFWLRRRRRTRVAPSAEFMSAAAAASHSADAKEASLPLARQNSLEDELPPAFTPGSFSDPIFEKLRSAEMQRQQYQDYNPYRFEREETTGVAEGGSRDKYGRSFLIE
ncbi:hypothetical protein POSPLADRAFT_1038961 [Postia placenta MAD-698-R-SB12]|uniref:Mid2 domain-containing protein n=1 Tax=Postia placenta MAD-698-R-SB12 TaxID=670580 RepID=A0A1X6N952_9APHY|nr:hypothetical protein POSPLADRAFT_1038961 [Postia placenta MAD-698-R-SB12]OSX65167.1 hypothetical protein POSPLADRAFT_1038961 [Postia placenta MAD-698-R-SB12]